MARKRRRFSAEFKAKVALEAVRGQKTLAELTERDEPTTLTEMVLEHNDHVDGPYQRSENHPLNRDPACATGDDAAQPVAPPR